jgi:TSS9, PorZ, N-terminal beta-propeller domain/Two component regulator propeller
MVRKWIFLFLLNGLHLTLLAQSDIPVGSWRTHNSFNSLVAISHSNTNIFAASSNALFEYNPANNEITQITSLSGLNDADITAIGYNFNVEKLIITYKNGNIDIIQNNQIVNMPDLLRADFIGSKEVHHIYNYQEKSYLSANFGLMIVNINTLQVEDTYFELGPSGEEIAIFASAITSDSLYLATELGIMRGSLKDNLKDFNQWQYFNMANGLPESAAKVILPTPNGLLTAIDNFGVYEYNGISWQNKKTMANSIFMHGSQSGDVSVLTTPDTVYQYSSGSVTTIATGIGEQPQEAILFDSNIWVADARNGLVNADDNLSVYPNGPFSNDLVTLYNYEDKIVAMPPAYDNTFKPLRNNAGFFLFTDGTWENFNSTGYPYTNVIPEFYDITGAAYSLLDGSLFLSSFGYGILKWDGQSTEILDENNSSLININPPERNVLISAIDATGRELAVINYAAFQSLHLKDIENNSWLPFSPSSPATNADQIVDLGNGTYWLKIPYAFGGGIMVFDAINLRELYLTDTNGPSGLPHNNVFDLALDKEGKMWVATEKGVVYYHQAANILDNGNIDPVLPVFEGQILFKNEKITALDVDGGNRIWMGATSGLWLFANDGQEVVSHFSADESPLPANEILDIAINQSTGEVFVATTNGLVSYRGTATSAGKLNEVKIFPNPVIAAQHDIVTIEGVPEDADLWITDAAGRLIYKTRANGNTAVWQGLSGNPSISSGVYFVFITNEDGSERQIGKLAIIN